jgi:hypothetical protein
VVEGNQEQHGTLVLAVTFEHLHDYLPVAIVVFDDLALCEHKDLGARIIIPESISIGEERFLFGEQQVRLVHFPIRGVIGLGTFDDADVPTLCNRLVTWR